MQLAAAIGKCRHACRHFGPSFVLTFLTAAIANLVLNGVLFTDHGLDVPPLPQSLSLFLGGTLILWAALLLFVALSGRLRTASATFVAVATLISYINLLKLQYRHEPLYPSDVTFLKDSGFLLELIGPRQVILGLVLSSLVFLALLLSQRLLWSAWKPVGPTVERIRWPIRVVAAAASIGVLAYAAAFNSGDNGLRRLFEASGASWRHWSQAENYVYNGFVPGILYNLPTRAMRAPAGYGEDAMRTVVERYREEASILNADRSAAGLNGTNVVLVLSEGFTDPMAMPGVELSEDPVPYTRALLGNSTSGSVLAQGYGGGTANMEFSALTGQSIEAFQPGSRLAYQNVVSGRPGFPSLVGYLETLGFRSVAIHPWHPNIYRRNAAYEALGMDAFISLDGMKNSSPVVPGHYVSDNAVFREVDRVIKENDAPTLVNVVTMQNHMPFSGVYPDPFQVSGELSRTEAQKVGQYARGLRHTDEALAAWLERLSDSRERTVVVFYGDHQPPVWESDTLSAVGELAARRTPVFVWSNFGGGRRRQLTTTSPIHFMNLVFDVTEAPVPPYLALLRRLEEVVPAMSGDLFLDPHGAVVLRENLPEKAGQILHDYSLVQYDFSVGERYAVAHMFYDSGTSHFASAP